MYPPLIVLSSPKVLVPDSDPELSEFEDVESDSAKSDVSWVRCWMHNSVLILFSVMRTLDVRVCVSSYVLCILIAFPISIIREGSIQGGQGYSDSAIKGGTGALWDEWCTNLVGTIIFLLRICVLPFSTPANRTLVVSMLNFYVYRVIYSTSPPFFLLL